VTSPPEPLTIAPTPITFSLTQPDALLPQFGPESGYFGSNDIRVDGTSIEISGSEDYNWTDGTVYMVGSSRASASLPMVSPLVIVHDANGWVPERQAAEEGISFVVQRLDRALEPATVAWWVTADTSWDYAREPAPWEQRCMPLGVDDLPGGVVPSGTVSFAAGEWTKTVTVRLADDDAAEWSERLQLNVAQDDNGLFRLKTVGTAVVMDDDPKPTFKLVPRENNPAEGTGGTTTLMFDVMRSGNMAGTVSAHWSIAFPRDSPGPFPDASDFAGGVLPYGAVMLPDGQERTTITIELAADAIFERDEALHISLRPMQDSNSNYNADWNARVTIRDDEPIDDIVVWGRDGLTRAATPERYAGPQVPGLLKQCVIWSDEDLMLQALGPGWFIRTGAGDDAVVLAGGRAEHRGLRHRVQLHHSRRRGRYDVRGYQAARRGELEHDRGDGGRRLGNGVGNVAVRRGDPLAGRVGIGRVQGDDGDRGGAGAPGGLRDPGRGEPGGFRRRARDSMAHLRRRNPLSPDRAGLVTATA
jgi:hypothetical protein